MRMHKQNFSQKTESIACVYIIHLILWFLVCHSFHIAIENAIEKEMKRNGVCMLEPLKKFKCYSYRRSGFHVTSFSMKCARVHRIDLIIEKINSTRTLFLLCVFAFSISSCTMHRHTHIHRRFYSELFEKRP